MSERRETGRRRPASPGNPKRGRGTPMRTPPTGPSHPSKPDPADAWAEGERIAKYLARAGIGSRREVEAMIEAGKVSVDGRRLTSPAVKVTGRETIRVGRQIVRPPDPVRVWRYHKPSGLICTNADPEGRPTVFDALPKSLPRVVTVGRLDLTTEGLLLLTNDGELARALELPETGLQRTYRVRAFGRTDQAILDRLRDGLTVDGERYGAIEATLEQETGANNWLRVTLTEGRKREVRRALEAVGLTVNRLIRVGYGPFELEDLKPGAVAEVPAATVLAELSDHIPHERRPAPDGKPDRTARAPTGRGGRRPPAASRLHRRRD